MFLFLKYLVDKGLELLEEEFHLGVPNLGPVPKLMYWHLQDRDFLGLIWPCPGLHPEPTSPWTWSHTGGAFRNKLFDYPSSPNLQCTLSWWPVGVWINTKTLPGIKVWWQEQSSCHQQEKQRVQGKLAEDVAKVNDVQNPEGFKLLLVQKLPWLCRIGWWSCIRELKVEGTNWW